MEHSKINEEQMWKEIVPLKKITKFLYINGKKELNH